MIVHLRSGPLRLLGLLAGVVLLLAASVTRIVLKGAGPTSVVILAFASLLVGFLLVRYPIRSEFDAEGICVWTPLTRRRIIWGDILALRRTRGTPVRTAGKRGLRDGSLLAVTDRGRVLLRDGAESEVEARAVRELLGAVSPALLEAYVVSSSSWARR